jgi:hypothetical protein
MSGGWVPVVRRRILGKGVRGWIWWEYSVHMYVKRKMIPAETVPRMGMGGIKEEDGVG